MMIPQNPIAIVGMSIRVPGASTLDAYRALLRTGTCAVTNIPEDRWVASTSSEDRGMSVGGLLDDVRSFDRRAFGLSPKEAARMDPQQRLLLELAAEALDDAGRPRRGFDGTCTGVYIGGMWSDYLTRILEYPERIDPYTLSGATLSFLANRISFAFGLEGPSLVVDTACTSSLAAMHTACTALRTGECDFALAGAVNVLLAKGTMTAMHAAGILSKSGQCRPLDEACDGFVRGEGGGIVALKRLADVEPWERVYAVVRGSAVNHNGRGPWIMAPRQEAQVAVIRHALARAGIEGNDVQYVELHGTGFRLGDAVEVRALQAALGRDAKCRVGSVKGNLGNLEAAAGIASVVKVALSLFDADLYPTIHLSRLNPGLVEVAGRIDPQLDHETWPASALRTAGITASSYSGSNAHVLLQSIDVAEETAVESADVFIFASTDDDGLRRHIGAVRDALERGTFEHADLRRVASALAHRLPQGEARAALVASSTSALRAALDTALDVPSPRAVFGVSSERSRRLAEQFVRDGLVDLASWPARVTSAPSAPWQRVECWLDALRAPSAEMDRPATPVDTSPLTDASTWRAVLAALPEPRRIAWLTEAIATEARLLMELDEHEPLSIDRPFFELGITSVALAQLRAALRRHLGVDVTPVRMFYHPTIHELAQATLSLWAGQTVPTSNVGSSDARSEVVAATTEQAPTSVEAELRRRLQTLNLE